MIEPVVKIWNDPLEPLEAWLRVANCPGVLFFDSVRNDTPRGRYSFLCCDPVETMVIQEPGENSVERLRATTGRFQAATIPNLPPFQGGAAGLIGYDFGRCLEKIPPPHIDEFQLPIAQLGIYDRVVAWDHELNKAWLISHGFPETGRRKEHYAEHRLKQLESLLNQPVSLQPISPAETLSIDQLARCYPVEGREGLFSNLSAEQYREMVARGVEYIHAGDVFQVNLSQRLLAPMTTSAPRVYEQLRSQNPAPFAGYYDLGDFQIISASPERLLNLKNGEIEARPIKGTRQRTGRAVADLHTAAELTQSEKDRAENVMIVDLLRNDLSRVCLDDSVRVSAICNVEQYQYVQHLVSVIEATLAPQYNAVDLLAAVFPGGSITGAPKIRAMEIIAELEPTARGAYCGSLGYIGFDGSMDLNILIRTIVAGKGWLQMCVGGGVVAQSSPNDELQESWHKANGLIQAALNAQ